ncbi:hypothetical protein NQ318_016795 [Aromia moschata]|uniref:Uncharacterized protein n=1 Tax=Aromia moschata TaxID=1265417 RepID=A0AAV8Y517_9CUCU|nr:hypothetical protein NQ318_016795 [Aromia moschata]
MLKANPLLKLEMEGKDLSLVTKQLKTSSSQINKASNGLKNLLPRPEKQSLQPNFNKEKPLVSNLQRSNSLKNPPKTMSRPAAKGASIISGNKPKTSTNTHSANISRQSNVDFNTSTSRFLCSTKLENASAQKKKSIGAKPRPTSKITGKNGSSSVTQDSSISSSGKPTHTNCREKKVKPMRRSLSAQHFDRKKGVTKVKPEKCINRAELTHSLEDLSSLRPVVLQSDISPIAEGSRESSIVFKTPSAYERRKDGKNSEDIDEENKENIEVDQDLDKGSYEDLKIVTNGDVKTINGENHVAVNGENAERIARAALEDLLKLIQEAPVRGWLELIRKKYIKLEEEPQYWECRAAIEQSRGNISNAVQCYKTAIVQGAEIQAVDESLDILLQKFSLLNINTDNAESERSTRERARIVQDARNVFKSSIIQFAVQERKLKKDKQDDQKKTDSNASKEEHEAFSDCIHIYSGSEVMLLTARVGQYGMRRFPQK